MSYYKFREHRTLCFPPFPPQAKQNQTLGACDIYLIWVLKTHRTAYKKIILQCPINGRTIMQIQRMGRIQVWMKQCDTKQAKGDKARSWRTLAECIKRFSYSTSNRKPLKDFKQRDEGTLVFLKDDCSLQSKLQGNEVAAEKSIRKW